MPTAHLHQFAAREEDGTICADTTVERMREIVMSGDVVLLKDVFPQDQLIALREATWAWSRATPITGPQQSPDTNHHAFESGVSPLQKTLHAYHSYNFNQIFDLPSPLQDQALRVFRPLREFQNALSQRQAEFERDADGRKLHPQIIQYPRGGGLFGAHVHALEPQRLGLILAISKRGVDFDTGGTGFEVGDRLPLDTSNVHDIGDLLIFRYDIRHWISFVDLERPLDIDAPSGRWTLIMPYY